MNYACYFYVLWNHSVYVFFDTDHHHKSHIHVKYSDQEAVVQIPNGEILAGEIQKN